MSGRDRLGGSGGSDLGESGADSPVTEPQREVLWYHLTITVVVEVMLDFPVRCGTVTSLCSRDAHVSLNGIETLDQPTVGSIPDRPE